MKPLAHTLQPKFNLDAERCILSALLTNNDAYHQVSSILAPDDFFEDLHANAYGAISELIQPNQPATPITLGSYFGTEPVVEGMSMTQYLGMLQGVVA